MKYRNVKNKFMETIIIYIIQGGGNVQDGSLYERNNGTVYQGSRASIFTIYCIPVPSQLLIQKS